MTSITLTVTGAKARATVTGPLTSGMVGIPVTIEYDDTWNGLTKNLVCRCGQWGPDRGVTRTVLSIEETATVAHEVMMADMYLYLGIEGYSADGELVIPTIWADCGKIQYGANADADPSAKMKLSIWAQLQEEIKKLKQHMITEEQIADVVASYLEENLIGTPDSPQSGIGLTTAQICALEAMFKVCAFVKEDVSAEYTAFKTAFGLEDSSGDSGGSEDLHTHSYTSSVTTAATCTTAGVRTYNCSCGASYTESIPETGHNYVNGICTVCGAKDPDYTPDVTLSGISATYRGGDVAVGTAVTALNGIVVTVTYSNGSSANVTDYTLSGEIAEGENTVTVTYQSMTTTVIVIGVADTSGGNTDNNIDIPSENLLGYYDMRTALTADNYITDLSGNGRDILFYPDNGYYEKGSMYRGDKASNWAVAVSDYSITDGANGKYSYGEEITMFVTISGYTSGTTPLMNTGGTVSTKQLITFQNGAILYDQVAGFNNVASSTTLTKEGVTTICAVITASEEKIYLDGVLKNTSQRKGAAFGTYMHLLLGYSGSPDVDTKIHNAAVYNAALTNDEVASISMTLYTNAGGDV